MKEQTVERIVREHLKANYLTRGYKITKGSAKLKKLGQHGADITLYNQSYGKYITIEVKKHSDRSAQNYNTFYSFFGQILSRIDATPSLNYSKKKLFVLAAPVEFVNFMHKVLHNTKNYKKHGMLGGWMLFGKGTNLRIWAVDMKNKEVDKEYSWRALMSKDFKA